MYKIKKLWLPGYTGMLGSALLKKFNKLNINVLKTNSKNLDLSNYNKVFNFLKRNKPDTVVLCAAKVGGIYANNSYPANFIFDNLKIAINVLDASRKNNVKKLLFIGSSCIYPKNTKQPIKEEYLLSGPLEKTNQWYALAKIAGLKMVESLRIQHKCNYISIMPTNTYGINDNFHSMDSHVVPALIKKIYNAKINKKKYVKLWGTGKALRDLLFVDDLADAIILLIRKYNKLGHINCGSGKEISIKNLSKMIANILNYNGKIIFDKNYPDGTLKKRLDIAKIKKLGWKPKISLRNGLIKTVDWYINKNKS
jgi:GDP-L-fucose synthase